MRDRPEMPARRTSTTRKNACGAHKDRHECIGQGFIGVDAFQRIVTHPALRDLPFILETPNELPGYAAEIKLLRELAERE